MPEIVDEINEKDEVLSQRTLEECLAQGLLHRAISMFLWNSKNQVFLQRRSLEDDWFPGYWTTSCAGHVKAGENCLHAGLRELKEELGIDSAKPLLLFKFIVPMIRYRNSIEYEMMYVLESRSGDLEMKLNPIEVEEGLFVSVPELKRFLVTNKDSITPDARLSFEKYIKTKGI